MTAIVFLYRRQLFHQSYQLYQTASTSCHGSILISNDNRDVEPVKSAQDSLNVPAGHTVWLDLALGYPVGDGVELKKKENVVGFV